MKTRHIEKENTKGDGLTIFNFIFHALELALMIFAVIYTPMPLKIVTFALLGLDIVLSFIYCIKEEFKDDTTNNR